MPNRAGLSLSMYLTQKLPQRYGRQRYVSATRDGRAKSGRTAGWALCVIVAVLLTWWHQNRFSGGTPASRLDLLHALVKHGTFFIDRYHENTPDKASHRGHFYSDKAPGTAILALPAFAAADMLMRSKGNEEDSLGAWLTTSWAACAFSQALPATLGTVAFFAWLQRFTRLRVALITSLTLSMGSLTLPYSTLLFSHAQVIGLIGVAVWALDVCGRPLEHSQPDADIQPARKDRAYLAGSCLGWALASEYTAGIVVMGVGVSAVVGRKDRIWPLVLGAVPPLLLIPFYSWVTIGSVLQLPYSFQASFPEMKEGLYGIEYPDLGNFGQLLLGPTRGLVFWTPFLVMAGFGWWWVAKERPRWLWLTYVLPLLHALVISGRTWDWQAGHTVSARYMAPILPLLALPCAIGTQRWPRLGITLAIVSIGMMTLATITDACPDYTIYNPLTELHIPKFLRGEFSYNLGTEVFGLPPCVSAALFYAVLIGGMGWLWQLAGKAGRERGEAPVNGWLSGC